MSEGTGYSGPSAYQIASEVRSQLQSELNAIQNNISITNNNVQIVSSRVDEVDDKVLVIYREMLAFIREQRLSNRLNQAETRIGTIRQELEKKSLILTSNRTIKEWLSDFTDPRDEKRAQAAIDRLAQDTLLFTFLGESHRVLQSKMTSPVV